MVSSLIVAGIILAVAVLGLYLKRRQAKKPPVGNDLYTLF